MLYHADPRAGTGERVGFEDDIVEEYLCNSVFKCNRTDRDILIQYAADTCSGDKSWMRGERNADRDSTRLNAFGFNKLFPAIMKIDYVILDSQLGKYYRFGKLEKIS